MAPCRGRRLTDRPTGTLGTGPTLTTFDDYQFHERDLTKIPSVRSGREWLGEYLTTDTTQTFPFDMPGVVPNAVAHLTASVVADAAVPTKFSLRLNGQPVGAVPVPPLPYYANRFRETDTNYDYNAYARTDTFRTALTTADSPLRLTITFQKNGQYLAQGYLDYLAVQIRRDLRQYDQPTWVRNLPAGQYAVRQATTALRVWDVSNPLAPVAQTYVRSAVAEANWSVARPADYFLFTDAQLLSPASMVAVSNQNLHGQPAPDLIIVTPVAWRQQADRLAQFRQEHDGLTALVATTQQVYNEFGSGQPDPTAIRDMARYFYQKQAGKLRYLLLLGDATYDYRNIAGLLNPVQLANTVPVYESRESLHPVLSYSSDDYFGFMDANEGKWLETSAGDERMDIGVGRLPVKSVEEAQTVVDKIIRYAADPSLSGDWQTRVMFVADDGDYNVHQNDANQLAISVGQTAPAYHPERIFLDAYPKENTSEGQKEPIVNQLINQGIADGRLIINYSGHGGVVGLADEQVVTLRDILSWKNRRLPLFVTATCQFGRYDDPSVNSGAELALLSRTGGAIGLLTTTRPVYANTNLLLNQAFYLAVFTPLDGQMPRLGDVMRLTKNNSLSGPVNRNFALLGDPSLRLAYPRARAVLTQINGRAVANVRSDTLRALQPVELTGEIQQQNSRLTNFSGTLRLTLYDKATTQTTLGSRPDSPKMSYQAFTNPVFTGQVPVQQGRFTVRFTMPKDIDYAIGPGKLYVYAVRTDSLLDAAGSYDSLRIGGSVFADSLDTQPPVLALSVVGGVVDGEVVRVAGPDVTLHVGLSDNRGINVARSGLGHELTAQLGEQPLVVLNEMYVANGSDGRQGEVRYTFRDVAPGTYRVRVRAWDINNNSTGGALTIVVSERPGLALRTLRVSPNPVVGETTLTAETNRSGEALDWQLEIYDLGGRLLYGQTGQCSDCTGPVEVGRWSGLTDAGQPLPNGLYVVRLRVQSATDGSAAVGSERAVLLK